MNPIFNDNRLKLGVFGLNGKGTANTLVAEAHRPLWEVNLGAARAADAAGFEAIVAYSRWKGHMPGDLDQPTGTVLDPMTWAAGLSQATRYSAIFATTNAHTIHPITAAKQCATIDAISGGRFGLNIVAGWFRPELAMFNVPPMSREQRYEHLSEWFEIMSRVWTESEEFDFDGRFFKVSRCGTRPRPLQRPRPPIMNAGASALGQAFAARVADICFIQLASSNASETRDQIDSYKRAAAEQHDRKIQVWSIATIVQRETVAEAKEYFRYYAVEHADRRTIDAWMKNAVRDPSSMSAEQIEKLRLSVAGGLGSNIIVGDADVIANSLLQLSASGVDGILLSWVNFQDGIARFIRDVLPRLEAAGLRGPFQTPVPS